MPKSRGFTIIELLITITIIAILSAIGFVAYSAVMQQGRDSKRQSDLRSIQSALEQYNSDQGFYPAASPNGFTTGSPLTSSTGNPSPPPTVKTYMNTVPNDSNATYPYTYDALSAGCTNVSTTTQCSSYCLYAKLDSPPSPLPSPPTGCTYPTGGYNFAVTPP